MSGSINETISDEKKRIYIENLKSLCAQPNTDTDEIGKTSKERDTLPTGELRDHADIIQGTNSRNLLIDHNNINAAGGNFTQTFLIHN